MAVVVVVRLLVFNLISCVFWNLLIFVRFKVICFVTFWYGCSVGDCILCLLIVLLAVVDLFLFDIGCFDGLVLRMLLLILYICCLFCFAFVVYFGSLVCCLFELWWFWVVGLFCLNILVIVVARGSGLLLVLRLLVR